MTNLKRDGYSLVELLIAMALTAIVLTGLVALFSYGTHNMRITQAMVALQNQAKDATNHISTYAMEASDIKWDEVNKVLTIKRESVPQQINSEGNYPDPDIETCYYWWADSDGDGVGAVYFAKHDKVADPSDPTKANLTSGQNFLLADDIEDFRCEVKENEDTGKKVLHVEMQLENERAKFECKKDIYMRNQTSEEETE